MNVLVQRTDITGMQVDAIVNPANLLGIMDEGVALAIKTRGGEDIQRKAMSYAPIAVGAAVVTPAGKLQSKAVIHAPTMERPGARATIENVRRAVRAALIAASYHGFEDMAIPGIATGPNGIDPDETARAIVDEMRGHKQPKPTTIYLVDTDEEVLAAFEEAIENVHLGF